MTFGGVKTYHLVHLDFVNNKYFVFEYQKDRRYTAKQAWQVISEGNCLYEGDLRKRANIIDDYQIVIDKFNLDLKHCDRYSSHAGFR